MTRGVAWLENTGEKKDGVLVSLFYFPLVSAPFVIWSTREIWRALICREGTLTRKERESLTRRELIKNQSDFFFF